MLQRFKSSLKDILKKKLIYYRVRERFHPAVQIQQRLLYHYYQDAIRKVEFPALPETGFRVFSQFEEDGKLLFIFAAIGMENKTFVDIGSDDGINSNCANLFFNFGWNGLFIDGNKAAVERGKYFYSRFPHKWNYKPRFACEKVTRENINSIISSNGFSGKIGLLSIDIDGNDYWIWENLSVADPEVVIIETHVEFGMNDIVVPYDPYYSFPGKHPVYHGASPVAMVKLGIRKGYRLVGANQLAFNFIFVKNGIAEDVLPAVSVESVLQHPSVKESQKLFDEIKDWDYVRG